jgi:hypothetical protein
MKPTDVVYVDLRTYEAHREVIDPWVIEHGLELTTVPLPVTLTFFSDHFEVELFLLNKQGRKYLVDGMPARHLVSVALRRPWPLLLPKVES